MVGYNQDTGRMNKQSRSHTIPNVKTAQHILHDLSLINNEIDYPRYSNYLCNYSHFLLHIILVFSTVNLCWKANLKPVGAKSICKSTRKLKFNYVVLYPPIT